MPSHPEVSRLGAWGASLRSALWRTWATYFCPVQFCRNCWRPYWSWRPWDSLWCSFECELVAMDDDDYDDPDLAIYDIDNDEDD